MAHLSYGFLDLENNLSGGIAPKGTTHMCSDLERQQLTAGTRLAGARATSDARATRRCMSAYRGCSTGQVYDSREALQWGWTAHATLF